MTSKNRDSKKSKGIPVRKGKKVVPLKEHRRIVPAERRKIIREDKEVGRKIPKKPGDGTEYGGPGVKEDK